jgi:Rps23 Pro-64 3,4-dihydroxylase Tpa1-like proline 4-hydroxylase
MKEMQRGTRFVVIDDFLSGRDFSAARDLMERATLTKVDSVISPSEDGPAFRSKGVRFGEELGSTEVVGRPRVYEQVARTVHRERDFYGEAGPDWDRIAFAFWKYPAGSRLGWHNDGGRGRRGEFILFLHDMWKPSWGGELMLVDENPEGLDEGDTRRDDPVEWMETLLGRCTRSPVAILPKRNRLVLVKTETIHTIRRVDPTAGAFLRCTLTGFIWRDLERAADRQSAREKFEAVLGGRL